MPRDTNGNTQPLPGTIVSTGDTILPSQHNPMVNDVYAMITQSLSRDGQGGMRAPLDMSGFRIFNVGPATASTDAVSLSQFQTGTPLGSVVDFAGNSAPSTWMFCFGQAISRADYSLLFAAIGTSFGAGDGSTTFNLPDCRGRVIAGKDNMGGTAANRMTFVLSGSTIGASGGNERHALDISEAPAHTHTGTTSTNGDHSHFLAGFAVTGGNLTVGAWGNGVRNDTSNLTGIAGAHSHTFTTDSKGGGLAHNNTQPTIILNKIIKVSY